MELLGSQSTPHTAALAQVLAKCWSCMPADEQVEVYQAYLAILGDPELARERHIIESALSLARIGGD
jgi:hypothetical protein